METIGHENKKVFKAKIFNLLTDFNNEKHWNSKDAKDLELLIESYSKIDRNFVKQTIALYENKTKQKLSAALYAAKGV